MVVPLGIMISLRSIHKHLWWPLTLKPETKFVTPRFKGKGRTVNFFYNFHMSTKLTAWIIVCAWWKGSEPCDVFSLLWCMLLVSCHCTAADSQPLSSRWCHYMGTLSDLLALLIWGNPMMTSSNENIFRVTGHLCGEFTGPRWIPHTKASDAELWCLLWSAPE